MKRKRDQVAHTETDKCVFDKEIRTLLAILVIFSSTYMLRGIWDLMLEVNFSHFNGMLSQLLVGLGCDFAPVFLLMVFHYKNFRIKKDKDWTNKLYQETQENAQSETYEVVNLNIVETLPASPGNFDLAKQNLALNEQSNENEYMFDKYLNTEAID